MNAAQTVDEINKQKKRTVHYYSEQNTFNATTSEAYLPY